VVDAIDDPDGRAIADGLVKLVGDDQFIGPSLKRS